MKHYELVPDPTNISEDYWCVKLTEGKFAGVIFKYGEIGLGTPDEETVNAQFEYDILFVPDDIRKMEFPDDVKEEFENLLGDIMIEMIQEQIEAKEDPMTNDTDKFLVSKRVYPESSPFKK